MSDWNQWDWRALERLRAKFLDGTAGQADYWETESDLASYDATFAQRIGWKWDYVLEELKQRDWRPAPGVLLDWGCGSGVAHRAFLDHFGTEGVERLHLWDRSPLALRFASRRAEEKYSGLELAMGVPSRIGTVLLSHVLTELEPRQVETLADTLATAADSILWVEPGTYEASLNLIAIRERLRDRFQIVGPCSHQERCGILQPGNEPHWCHHFASPPPEVFTDPNWGKFARLAGIDLRSLPLSFLVLDKRPAQSLPEGTVRLIGRPRLFKPHALVLACSECGVCDREISKRNLPDVYRSMRKGMVTPLQRIELDERGVVSVEPLYPGEAERESRRHGDHGDD